MSAIFSNSREVLELLEESGIKSEKARAITKAMETIDTSSLITKADLSDLEVKLTRFMFIQSAVIISLTVTLVKFL